MREAFQTESSMDSENSNTETEISMTASLTREHASDKAPTVPDPGIIKVNEKMGLCKATAKCHFQRADSTAGPGISAVPLVGVSL